MVNVILTLGQMRFLYGTYCTIQEAKNAIRNDKENYYMNNFTIEEQ